MSVKEIEKEMCKKDKLLDELAEVYLLVKGNDYAVNEVVEVFENEYREMVKLSVAYAMSR